MEPHQKIDVVTDIPVKNQSAAGVTTCNHIFPPLDPPSIGVAFEILASLYQRNRENLCTAGHDPNGARVRINDLVAALRERGIAPEVLDGLRDRVLIEGPYWTPAYETAILDQS